MAEIMALFVTLSVQLVGNSDSDKRLRMVLSCEFILVNN